MFREQTPFELYAAAATHVTSIITILSTFFTISLT